MDKNKNTKNDNENNNCKHNLKLKAQNAKLQREAKS